MELYQILIIVFAVIIAGLWIYKRITGVNILQKIALTKPVISAVAVAVEAAYKLWPNDILKIVHTVVRAAAEATETAENTWKMGALAKEDRNIYAKQLTKDTLEKAGIEVTDQVQMIISGMIEIVCMLLPHESKEKKEDGTQDHI